MKTYQVTVTYQDIQPGEETTTHEKKYLIESTGPWSAEIVALHKCQAEFWAYVPVEAVAEEFCYSCQNTGWANDGGGDAIPCEDCQHQRAA